MYNGQQWVSYYVTVSCQSYLHTVATHCSYTLYVIYIIHVCKSKKLLAQIIHVYISEQMNCLSLSTLVLNSRDWSEIVWLPKISGFKINLAISFIRKKPAGMHWLGYNDAVSSLNEAKTRIFQPTANFENFEIRLYFVSQPACLP